MLAGKVLIICSSRGSLLVVNERKRAIANGVRFTGRATQSKNRTGVS